MSTKTIKAWATSPENFTAGDETNPERLFFTNADMAENGWLLVGEAEITIHSTYSRDELVKSMVNTLEAQIEQERANSHVKISALQERINNLLCLTHEVTNEPV